jgi:hypothetical protein
MARPIRIEFAGAVYHVMARGNGGAIFEDDGDRLLFLERLGMGHHGRVTQAVSRMRRKFGRLRRQLEKAERQAGEEGK